VGGEMMGSEPSPAGYLHESARVVDEDSKYTRIERISE